MIFVIGNAFTANLIKHILGFAPKRPMPTVGNMTLRNWFKKHQKETSKNGYPNGKVYLFCDEFTNYNDVEIGQKAILLLNALGYEVLIPHHLESGRTYLSKGLVQEAQKIAIQNVELLSENMEENIPIVGIEPSAILTLKDEYLELVPSNLLEKAQKIAKNSFIIDEFLAQEIDKKRISKAAFTQEKRQIQVHGHCHQKALSSMTYTLKILSLPENYDVQLIPSGCCGMAGSFGYEKEHYDVSMKIGELVLFPTIRQQTSDVIIAATGTSCRHQIKDGTGVKAKHPVEILWAALETHTTA